MVDPDLTVMNNELSFLTNKKCFRFILLSYLHSLKFIPQAVAGGILFLHSPYMLYIQWSEVKDQGYSDLLVITQEFIY